jgi:hypothetical protein
MKKAQEYFFNISIATFTIVLLFWNITSSFAQHCFVANVGQVKDQNGKVRKDIDFVLQSSGGMTLYISAGKVSYQMVDSDQGYRLDVLLEHCYTNATVLPDAAQSYYERYYPEGLAGKSLIARSYQRIVYRNIYKGIDWVLYTQNGALEYEFVLQPDADAAKISMRYEGASQLRQLPDGSIVAKTPIGELHDAAPQSYTVDGKLIGSCFVLKGQRLHFAIAQQPSTAYVIDPTLRWATYYG